MNKQDYKKLSEIELTQEFQRLGRSLKSQAQAEASTPQAVAAIGRINADIEAIKVEQQALSKEMLKREEQRQKRQAKRLAEQRAAGEQAAAELLEKLPDFAYQVATAFGMLGETFAELLKLSEEVRKTEMALLNANARSGISASVKLEPPSLHRVLKSQFRESFGTASDVLLPQRTETFDIEAAVEAIQQACSREEIAAEGRG